jgi:GntR family transcriptional regulator
LEGENRSVPLHIDLDDAGGPIYLQIIEQLREHVASGELQPGEELPAIRNLADKLGANPTTVVRAYAELEAEGVVVKRSTKGTYVSREPNSPAVRRQRQLRLAGAIDALLENARRLKVSTKEVFELLRERCEADQHRAEER